MLLGWSVLRFSGKDGGSDDHGRGGMEMGLDGAKLKPVGPEKDTGRVNKSAGSCACAGEQELLSGDGGVTVTSSRHRAPQTGHTLPEKQRRWNVQCGRTPT